MNIIRKLGTWLGLVAGSGGPETPPLRAEAPPPQRVGFRDYVPRRSRRGGRCPACGTGGHKRLKHHGRSVK